MGSGAAVAAQRQRRVRQGLACLRRTPVHGQRPAVHAGREAEARTSADLLGGPDSRSCWPRQEGRGRGRARVSAYPSLPRRVTDLDLSAPGSPVRTAFVERTDVHFRFGLDTPPWR